MDGERRRRDARALMKEEALAERRPPGAPVFEKSLENCKISFLEGSGHFLPIMFPGHLILKVQGLKSKRLLVVG